MGNGPCYPVAGLPGVRAGGSLAGYAAVDRSTTQQAGCEVMECHRCHTPIPDEARFCLNCGANVSDPMGAGDTTAAMDAAAAEQLLRLVQEEVGSDFEVERELGRGGMAIVYLATEVNLGRKVAIKVLPPDILSFSAGAIERFKREARTAAKLDHPNIIPIYRVSPGGRLFWYAMKFIEGRSLTNILKEWRRLSLADTIRVLEQVASALDYAHSHQVVHRDIKPANVMLDAQNRVIVTDFGIAKQLAAGSLTASGSVIGTPYYMSPEQCQGSKTITGAADQYSVGVMAYEMLAGQVPFEGDSAVDILTKHILQPPPPLDVIRPGLPRHVYQAIERALAKKPTERFPSVGAFVRALQHPTEPISTPRRRAQATWAQVTTTPVAISRSSKWPRALTLAGLAGLALGGGALLLLNQQRAAMPAAGSTRHTDSAPSVGAVKTATEATSRRPPGPSPQGGALAPSAEEQSQRLSGPPPVTGRLMIAGLPPGGTVIIDGERRVGSSFELPAGTHTVRLLAPGFQPTQDTTITLRGGERVRLAFTGTPVPSQSPSPVVPEERLRAQRSLTGRIRVPATANPGERAPPAERQAQPPGGVQPGPTAVQTGILVIRTVGGWAKIYVNGALRRQGTSHRDSLPPGMHTLKIEREGYVTIDTTVTLQAGETKVVTITMLRTGGT